MRSRVLIVFFTGHITNAYACITCNEDLQAGIYNSTFFPNLLVMLSAFLALAVIVTVLFQLSTRRYNKFIKINSSQTYLNPVPFLTTSMVLGIGLGGFIDGIVLHQILQWHEMLSNKVQVTTLIGKSINMFWDGIFHLFCLAVVITGLILLWKLFFRKDIDYSGNLLAGGLIFGWGIFNNVEGVIDHHLLKLHNVRESANPGSWNTGFLILSLGMILTGYLLAYRNRKYKIDKGQT